MGELVRATAVPAFYQALDRRFDRQVGRMRYNTEVAKEGMYALGEVHSHAEFVVMRTLSEAARLKELWSKDAKLTPAEEHSYHLRMQQFLNHLSQITDRAGRQIILDIMNAPLEQRAGKLFPLHERPVWCKRTRGVSRLWTLSGLWRPCCFFGAIVLLSVYLVRVLERVDGIEDHTISGTAVPGHPPHAPHKPPKPRRHG